MAWVPVAAAVAGAIGTAVSAAGALQASSAQAESSRYQAQVARNNQVAAYQNAEYATQAAAQKATDTSLKGAERLAAVRAGIAANGIDVNTGSAADVQTSQRQTGVLETENEVQKGALQAYGYRSQASNFGAQAALDSASAKNEAAAGPISAAGTLLGGASSLGSQWVKMNGTPSS